jgi:hypothetical protein
MIHKNDRVLFKNTIKGCLLLSGRKQKKEKGLFPFPYGVTHLIRYYGNNYRFFVINIVSGTFDECTTSLEI